jgi:hypothetical protein
MRSKHLEGATSLMEALSIYGPKKSSLANRILSHTGADENEKFTATRDP